MPPKVLLEFASGFIEEIGSEVNAEFRDRGSPYFFGSDSAKLPLGWVAAISTGKFFRKNLLGFTRRLELVVFPRWFTSGGSTLSSFFSSPVELTFYSSTFVVASASFLFFLIKSSSLRLWASATCLSVFSLFELVSRRIFYLVIWLIFCFSRVSSWEIFILMYSLLNSFCIIECMLSVGSETIPKDCWVLGLTRSDPACDIFSRISKAIRSLSAFRSAARLS